MLISFELVSGGQLGVDLYVGLKGIVLGAGRRDSGSTAYVEEMRRPWCLGFVVEWSCREVWLSAGTWRGEWAVLGCEKV
ncbi:hypothetical protein [Beijerinckia mobilis]|uniref:hypothetical protein n=1 Tax=Beijerinckia mobilis TaxID=231434 RepID=UPI0005521777|nr:hypothetical protein [Beijerinckia mobilis]